MGDDSASAIDPEALLSTFRNLVRFREDIIQTFDQSDREFFEWSLEDMFYADGSLHIENHQVLFDFLQIETNRPFFSTFAKTPRPSSRQYLANFVDLKEYFSKAEDGIISRYFSDNYDPHVNKGVMIESGV